MRKKTNIPHVVVMGGGTGTFAVTSALKRLPCTISAIIAVSDSGGSTGRIRDEFGFQPVGDLRQSLAALADLSSQQWIQKILLYRFDKGSGLQGHNLGNLILTALQDMSGSTGKALEIAEKIFNLHGKVIPVTNQTVDLKIFYQDGSTVIGEHILDESDENPKSIDRVELTPECTLNPVAHEEILTADFICIGPGDLYASLLATLVVPGISEAFAQTKAKIVYIPNLMTRRTQTHNMTARQHVDKIAEVLGRNVDIILINNTTIPQAILKAYAAEQEFPVTDTLAADTRVIRADFLKEQPVPKTATDTAYRSLLRHDPEKLCAVFRTILFKA